tara:strand:+ start:284 stop:1312 length:1029 start_codon:yes stop_codon:yes gene_type:complete
MKILILFFIFFIINNSTLSKSLFEEDFYEIQFNSNNIDEDKILKIKNLKIKTISKIFSNILIKKDYDKIIKNIDIDLTNTFIKNIIINDEKIINDNYYSKIKINFDKKKIIYYLREHNISYIEYLPKNFLTVIYEDNNLNKNLFSKNNIHYDYLKKNIDKYRFYKIPNLDINDRYLLNHIDIENKNLDKFQNFKSKYSDHDLILIISKNNNTNIKYSIYFLDENIFINIKELDYVKYNFKDLFNRIEFLVLDQWKKQNSIQNIVINNLYCEVTFYNLLELKQIKKNLDNVSIIENYNLNKISNNLNFYNVEYYGNINILLKLLQLNNLNIKYNDKFCKISLR